MIDVRDLTKTFRHRRYGNVCAVDRINFVGRPGEIYGLLGVNGAGKTTTLRMLATLLRPDGGTASVAGFDVSECPDEVRARIGFLSTATALYGRLTARELVSYFGRLHKLTEETIQARMEAIFRELEMLEFQGRRCDQLSTGMKQKVSIARTLIHDPEVIILDEPTLGLDVIAARTIVRFIQDCRGRQKTVLFSSHVMSEVRKLCDRIGIIHEGRLLAQGSLKELQRHYEEADLEEIFVRVVQPAGGE